MGDHRTNIERARLALEGLSLGDAFGDQFFFSSERIDHHLSTRTLPPAPWLTTDDTIMSVSVVEVLDAHQGIDQGALATAFGRRYLHDPNRGYGGTAHRILRAIGQGAPWEAASRDAFDGMGSHGNGGAMRSAPIGAYFADVDIEVVVDQARRAAEVTHAHPDGQAGAVAVAVAAWVAARSGPTADPRELLQAVYDHLEPSDTRAGMRRALDIPFERAPATVAAMLGSGEKVSSADTVPYSLWCAARHLGNFEDGMWATVSGLGDRDTTCAIVGGIVSLAVGRGGLPPEWLARREPLTDFD